MKKLLQSLLLVLSTVPALPSQGQQFDPTHVYKIVNTYNNEALEIGGSNRNTPGHPANTWPYWGGSNQQWMFTQTGTNSRGVAYYKIENRNSRQALTEPCPLYTINEGTLCSVTQRPYSSTSSNGAVQNWAVVSVGNGRYRISGDVESTITALQINGGTSRDPVVGYYANPNGTIQPWRTWYIEDVSAPTPGVFRIMNYNSGKALSAGEDNSVGQQPMWYIASQEWTFSPYNADGYLYIINRNTGQVLEIGGGGDLTQPGRSANVWDNYGHPWQQWALLDINDSHRLTVEEIFTTGMRCKIYNRHSGKVLEIGGNGGELFQDGRPANQWYDWSGPNQQWNIYIDSNYRGTGSGTGASQQNAIESAISAPSATTPSPLTVYPNPAHNTLRVSMGGQRELSRVTLTDAQGRGRSVPCRQGQVDVSDLVPGLYLVTVDDGQHTYRQKFIKE